MTGIDWLRPGIHPDIPADQYHSAGITQQPALSAGAAQLLIAQSPLHAWWNHPQLNPACVRKDEQKFDIGTAAHSILLQGEDIVDVCDYADWRTNAAKEQRDAARHQGLIPLLTGQWEEVCRMVEAVKRQLPDLNVDPPLFTDGQPEQTLIWQEDNGIACKARIDWLRGDHRAIDDYKTSGGSARPDVWSRRTFWSIGCDVQIAFHSRGVHQLTGDWPTWRYVVCETAPPYAVSVISPGPSVLELGQRKVEYAINKWSACLASDSWPAYPREVAEVELDSWQDADFLRLTYEAEVAA